MIFFLWFSIWMDHGSYTICHHNFCYSRIDDSGMGRVPRKT